MNNSKNQKKFYGISIIFIFTSLIVLAFPLLAEENTGDSVTTKSIQAVEELIANMDKEYVINNAKENKESTYAKWFKGICKSTKTLGSILEYCEKIDSEIFVFKELVPAQIPDKVWIRYFGEGKIRFGKIKEVVVVWTQKKTNLVYNFEETGQKVGYVLAAFSIAQDIYNALGSNDDKRLKAIYTTAKHVLFNYLFKKIGVSINPFISIGISVLEWGLNTFIKQTFDRHRRDWEQAYRKYMDQHYPEEYWDRLLKTTFNETGGVSRAKSKIREALEKFWENPDVNFNDIMDKSSTFSSTRGGALADQYKKNLVADYYNWYVKPKITVLLRTEMMYARNEARYAAINSIKKLLTKNNEEDLKNLAKAIDMAKDFKKATLSVEPENVTLKAGESKTFSVTLKIGSDSLAIANEDIEWSHSNGTFNADDSMIGKTINIKATYAGKTGTATIKVGDKTDEALIKALAAAKAILEQMKKTISDAQKIISDADEICRSGKAQLELAQKALPTKEFLERESPLNNYEQLKTSIMDKVDQLELLMKKSTDDYTSAGVYKRNCENKTMEACEGAYLLRRIMDAKTSALTSTIPEPELGKNPGRIMNNVSNTAAKAEEYGNQALSDIKSVVEAGKNAKKIYNSIKNSVDNYVKDLLKAKKQQDKEFNQSRNHLKNARSELTKLYGKIEKIKQTENQLKSSSIKAKNLLIPFKSSEKVGPLLKEITKCYEDFEETVKKSKECYAGLKSGIDQFAGSYMNDRIEYDSRENRENTGRLVKKAYGYLVGIDQDVRNARSLESAVQNAMKNAKKCKDKAQDFLDRIRDIQKERGETDSSESDLSTSGGETPDEGRCLFLKRAFYARIRWSDSDSAIKEAAEILERAKDCPFYEEGLRELNRLRAGEEGGFSTSGGETISEDSSSTPRTDKDNCIKLENDFYAALDTGDINWVQSILNKSRDCPFYSRGTDMLQNAIEAQEEENKRQYTLPSSDSTSNARPPVNVEIAQQGHFVGKFNLADPARSRAQYYGFVHFKSDGTFTSWENPSGSGKGIWSFNPATLIFTIDWRPGGRFSGPVSGNTNNFTISGHWSNENPGRLNIYRQ